MFFTDVLQIAFWIRTKVFECQSIQAQFRWEIPSGILEFLFCFRRAPFSINIYGHKYKYVIIVMIFSVAHIQKEMTNFWTKPFCFKTSLLGFNMFMCSNFLKTWLIGTGISASILSVFLRSMLTTTFRDLSAVNNINRQSTLLITNCMHFLNKVTISAEKKKKSRLKGNTCSCKLLCCRYQPRRLCRWLCVCKPDLNTPSSISGWLILSKVEHTISQGTRRHLWISPSQNTN